MYKLFFTIFAFLVLLSSCDKQSPTSYNLESKGTITYLFLEGGFYGIITDDGNNLDPINLKDEYKQNGLKVKLTYKERMDLGSIHMWGKLVEIIEIQKIDE